MHGADHGVPSGILQAVTETCEYEHNDEHGIGWVNGYDNIRDEARASAEEGDASLAIVYMNKIVK